MRHFIHFQPQSVFVEIPYKKTQLKGHFTLLTTTFFGIEIDQPIQGYHAYTHVPKELQENYHFYDTIDGVSRRCLSCSIDSLSGIYEGYLLFKDQKVVSMLRNYVKTQIEEKQGFFDKIRKEANETHETIIDLRKKLDEGIITKTRFSLSIKELYLKIDNPEIGYHDAANSMTKFIYKNTDKQLSRDIASQFFLNSFKAELFQEEKGK